jgi:hypothetical protein
LFDYFDAASADIDRCAELQKSLRHGPTNTGASAGDEDALIFEEISSKHEGPFREGITVAQGLSGRSDGG